MKSQSKNEWPTSDTDHITSALMQKTYKRINATKKQNLDNNKIYFAKRQVQQKGKSPSKLATILTADKQKKEQKTEKKN